MESMCCAFYIITSRRWHGILDGTCASSEEQHQTLDSSCDGHPEMMHPAHLHGAKIDITLDCSSQQAQHRSLSAPCAGLHGAAVAVTGRRQPVLDSAVEALTSEGIKAIGVQVSMPCMAYAHCLNATAINSLCRAYSDSITGTPAAQAERCTQTVQRHLCCLCTYVMEVRGVCMAQGDVRKSQDCERWLKETCDRLGGLDILINCAAGNFLVGLLCIVSASGSALLLVCSLACIS